MLNLLVTDLFIFDLLVDLFDLNLLIIAGPAVTGLDEFPCMNDGSPHSGFLSLGKANPRSGTLILMNQQQKIYLFHC
jgi:hypothetical protein